MNDNSGLNFGRGKGFRGANRLMIMLAVILASALMTGAAFAHYLLTDEMKTESSKKDEKEKKADKKKSKSVDDDDEDSDKSRKIEKESRAKSSDLKSESGKSETKAVKNSAPTVSLTVAALESVNATVETDPVPHGGDAADDPAIWINQADPSQSTIIGTDKQGGLAVYDLSGKQIQYLADGKMDNVDLRDGFKLSGQSVAIVTAGNRQDNSLAVYKVNPQTRQLENVAARKISTMPVYGSCMYRSAKNDKVYYFATSKSGEVEQWELFDGGSGKVDAKKVRNFKVGSVIEGCVTDDQLGHFYVSEEAVGIWKYGAEPEAGNTRTQVAKVGDGNLFADVEGLAIAYGKDETGYLMVSSQGNHTFVVYRRDGNNEFVKKFRVSNGGGVDGAEETDGIDVTTVNLGPAFPHGVFVAQDGFNDKGNQNFKLVPLQSIIK